LFKAHNTVSGPFKDLLRMSEKKIRGAAVASGTFKINERKICGYFLLILTKI
jgi:hypothetical protein